MNKSRKDYAYSLFDLETELPADLLEKLKNIEGVLKVRVL